MNDEDSTSGKIAEPRLDIDDTADGKSGLSYSTHGSLNTPFVNSADDEVKKLKLWERAKLPWRAYTEVSNSNSNLPHVHGGFRPSISFQTQEIRLGNEMSKYKIGAFAPSSNFTASDSNGSQAITEISQVEKEYSTIANFIGFMRRRNQIFEDLDKQNQDSTLYDYLAEFTEECLKVATQSLEKKGVAQPIVSVISEGFGDTADGIASNNTWNVWARLPLPERIPGHSTLQSGTLGETQRHVIYQHQRTTSKNLGEIPPLSAQYWSQQRGPHVMEE